MMERLEELDFPAGELTAEEMASRAILAALIRVYNQKVDLPTTTPNEMLKYVMEQRSLKQADLVPVLGTRAQVSDLVTGKRGISKGQAKKFAELFHTGVELFI